MMLSLLKADFGEMRFRSLSLFLGAGFGELVWDFGFLGFFGVDGGGDEDDEGSDGDEDDEFWATFMMRKFAAMIVATAIL